MELMEKRFLVLVGNYGSGKTELALNRALEFAAKKSTTLVDLDIVNPYFRSGEKADMLREAGIRVLMPTFALSTVDIPALPAEIQSVFELPCDHVIFDVGGDDTGAAALGRYAPSFAKYREQTHVALVVNCMRPLTQTAEDVAELAQRIALELKDKVGKGLADGTGFGGGAAAAAPAPSSAPAQAVAALVALGYNTSDAAAAVARIDETLPVQDIIKIALRGLSRA